MNVELSRRAHRQVLLIVVTVLLAGLATQPWWTDRLSGLDRGGEVVVTGWGMVGSLADWEAAQGEPADGFDLFIAWYVTLALVVLSAAVVVPPDAVRRWARVVLGFVAGCLGGGLALLDLVGASADTDDARYGAFHLAWLAALGISVLWFLSSRPDAE